MDEGMDEVFKYSIHSLLGREYSRISMGITPSRSIHFGFAFTLTYPFLYMQVHPETTLEIAITDKDVDPQLGRVFRPYDRLEDGQDCHETMREHVAGELRFIVNEFGERFGVDSDRVDIYYFSDYLKEEPYATEFRTLLTNPERSRKLKRAIFDRESRPYNVPFSPICPCCHHSNSHLGRVDYDKGELVSTCFRNGCENEEGEVRVSIGDSQEWNAHYMTTLTRDVFSLEGSPKPDLHIFGGDFGRIHGMRKLPKYERLRDVMRIFSGELPDIFIGQLVTWHNRKVGKSNKTYYPYLGFEDDARQRFLSGMVRAVHESAGYASVDYN